MRAILRIFLVLSVIHQASATTEVIRVPNGGIQPQAQVGKDGAIHLIYFKGQPAAGNLFYVTRSAGADSFASPIRINATDDAAIAMGTIRGAHLSLGRNDRVHVAWMGSGKTAKTPTEEGKHPQSPMLYTRLNDTGDAFEPERNVMQWTEGLDGGGSVAADSLGNVFVAWHGKDPQKTDGEHGRAMFVAVSRDEGATFARERQANLSPTGSCGCCGMRAFVDEANQLHLLYRAANPVSRDMTLLTSTDAGESFRLRSVNQWMTQTCPMSSASMADGKGELLVATELAGAIQLGVAEDPVSPLSRPVVVAPANAKHPVMISNEKGELLMAWAEGAAWGKGGRLKWQLFDASRDTLTDVQSGDELPTWSFPAVVATGASDFAVIF